MAALLRSVLGFVAIALLVSAVSAQIFADDGSSVPPEPPIAGDIPGDLAGTPLSELDPSGTKFKGTLDGPSTDLGASDSLNSAATEEDLTDVPPAALFGAVGLDGQVLNANSSQNGEANAICEANSLQSSNIQQVCSLVSNWRRGSDTTCSGWIVGDRYIATAGHCLYDRQRGGYVRNVRIYCNSYNGCRRRDQTTRSVSVSVSTNWFNSNTRDTNPWDGGVIKTRDRLPYNPLPWGEFIGPYQFSVYTAGYPGRQGESRRSPCRNFPEYTGCTQFASYGTLYSQLVFGFFRPDYDTCEGHSGGPLYNRYFGLVTGIQVGGGYNPTCNNLAVPLRISGYDSGCNHPDGGVGIDCLVTAADYRDN